MDTPSEPEREHRDELADALERRGHEIIDRWLREIRSDARAADVPPTALMDGIADYVSRLVELLRGHRPIEGAGTAAWNDVAREHAITRVRLGFDVVQLGHELVILRRVATDILVEEGVLDDARQLSRMTDLIEAAFNASIKSYVDYRDYTSRRAEEEHIGFLTHELKTPLTSIVLASNTLRESPLSAGQVRMLDTIDRNLQRLQKMLDDVLYAETLQRGTVETRPVELTADELLGDMLEVRRRAARNKGIELHATYDRETRLYLDPRLTLSALENLIDNAIKYTDEGAVAFTLEDEPGRLLFHVRDRCGGLSQSELQTIFEPFRRGHSNKPGTGLGLAIARRAIEAQGGSVQVESIDLGCHFWLSLPKSQH